MDIEELLHDYKQTKKTKTKRKKKMQLYINKDTTKKKKQIMTIKKRPIQNTKIPIIITTIIVKKKRIPWKKRENTTIRRS